MLKVHVTWGLAGLAACLLVGPAFADQYKYTKLKVPGSVETKAIAVNDTREVTGTYTQRNGKVRMFVWKDGVFRKFKAPPSHKQESITPTAIGSKGLVVGTYGDAEIFPFLLRPGADKVESIPYPGDGQNSVTPTSISDDGDVIAGYENYFDGTVHGFTTYPNADSPSWAEYSFGGFKSVTITTLADIGIPGVGYAGNYVKDAGQHGYRGQSSDPIDPPGSVNTWLTYMNRNADLGGHAENKKGDTFGWVRRGDDDFTIYQYPGTSHTIVIRNLRGTVYGEFKDEAGVAHAFQQVKGKYQELLTKFSDVTLTSVGYDGSFVGSYKAEDGSYRGYIATCDAGPGKCSGDKPKKNKAELVVTERR